MRPLRNSFKLQFSPFFMFARRQLWLIFLQAGQDVFAPLAAFASQRSVGDLEDRFFQVEGHGIEQKLQFDLGQAEIADSKEAVATLESAEGTFHL